MADVFIAEGEFQTRRRRIRRRWTAAHGALRGSRSNGRSLPTASAVD
jgi:hypothetical protein